MALVLRVGAQPRTGRTSPQRTHHHPTPPRQPPPPRRRPKRSAERCSRTHHRLDVGGARTAPPGVGPLRTPMANLNIPGGSNIPPTAPACLNRKCCDSFSPKGCKPIPPPSGRSPTRTSPSNGHRPESIAPQPTHRNPGPHLGKTVGSHRHRPHPRRLLQLQRNQATPRRLLNANACPM